MGERRPPEDGGPPQTTMARHRPTGATNAPHGHQTQSTRAHNRARTPDRSRLRADLMMDLLTPGTPPSTAAPRTFFAPTWAESRTTQETSIRPASSSRRRTASCSRRHTPALDQIRNGRWRWTFAVSPQSAWEHASAHSVSRFSSCGTAHARLRPGRADGTKDATRGCWPSR
jgi:hypothetical protein